MGARLVARVVVVLALGLPATTRASDDVDDAPDAPVVVGYEGGLYAQDPAGRWRARLRINLQPRLFATTVDEAGNEALVAAFVLRRARVTLSGSALLPALSFRLQTAFDLGVVQLTDAWVQYALVDDLLSLRAGRWKRPFSRPFIGSSFELEFVDLPITERAFDAGRDLGVALGNDYEQSPPLEYVIGVFNGDEVPVEVALPFRPAVVGRLGVNLGGIDGYEEADFEGGPLRLAVAASGRLDLDLDGSGDGRVLAEVDGVAKAYGGSMSAGLYLELAQQGAGALALAPSQVGARVQGGYVYLGTLEPALRYAVVAPVGGVRRHEGVAAFSVYFVEHAFKWQSDFSLLVFEDAGAVTTGARARTQLTFSF